MEEKIKVFVVDDSVVARNMLIRRLQDQEDIEIAGEAGSGPGCIIMLDEVNPDVVILEANLSGSMSLDEVIREIKNFRPDMKIILCSDPDAVASTVNAVTALGASDFVTKPYKTAQLLRTVREVYESGNE